MLLVLTWEPGLLSPQYPFLPTKTVTMPEPQKWFLPPGACFWQHQELLHPNLIRSQNGLVICSSQHPARLSGEGHYHAQTADQTQDPRPPWFPTNPQGSWEPSFCAQESLLLHPEPQNPKPVGIHYSYWYWPGLKIVTIFLDHRTLCTNRPDITSLPRTKSKLKINPQSSVSLTKMGLTSPWPLNNLSSTSFSLLLNDELSFRIVAFQETRR